mmetsp:Transcript_1083/g.2058  ORF Transcript_1083/g.2058 Transcript_1083/m.2058 type:complete len:243 (+) Transcript_1083:669-1397(+)
MSRVARPRRRGRLSYSEGISNGNCEIIASSMSPRSFSAACWSGNTLSASLLSAAATSLDTFSFKLASSASPFSLFSLGTEARMSLLFLARIFAASFASRLICDHLALPGTRAELAMLSRAISASRIGLLSIGSASRSNSCGFVIAFPEGSAYTLETGAVKAPARRKLERAAARHTFLCRSKPSETKRNRDDGSRTACGVWENVPDCVERMGFCNRNGVPGQICDPFEISTRTHPAFWSNAPA